MLRFNLKIAIRNLLKYKGYMLINITGLSVGLAASFIILIFSIKELTHDNKQKNSDRIYRIVSYDKNMDWTRPNSPFPMKEALENDFSEIEAVCRLYNLSDTKVKSGDTYLTQEKFYCADNELFAIFKFRFVLGSATKALRKPMSVVLTESMTKKYFGNKNPLGKSLVIKNQDDEYELTVTAVIEDCQKNSTIEFDFVTDIELAIKQMPKHVVTTANEKPTAEYYRTTWDFDFITTYIMTKSKVERKHFDEQFRQLEKKYIGDDSHNTYSIQPFKEIYFADGGKGNIQQIYVFVAIGILILLIATFNYIILSTANATNRLKEISIKKIAGSAKAQISLQMLTESLLICLVSLPIALILVEQFFPQFTSLLNRQVEFSFITDYEYLFGMICITLLTGVLSASYTAFYIASNKPVSLFAASHTIKSAKSPVRKILITIQFTIFISLLITSILVYKQIYFVTKSDPGFRRQNLISVNFFDNSIKGKYETVKEELKKIPEIENVSGAMWLPPTESTMQITMPHPSDKNRNMNFDAIFVDYDCVEMLDLKILDGRSFSHEFDDAFKSLLINETAANELGRDSIIGSFLFGTVIGVVNDFHLHSFHSEIPPVVIGLRPPMVNNMLIQLDGKSLKHSLNAAKSGWNKLLPDVEFNYTFLDEQTKMLYEKEQQLINILSIFTFLAIFIASLGLFGLSALLATQRTKEFGIRRVLGASPVSIIIIQSKQYTLWIVIALVIASPIAYYITSKWLQNFAYQTTISWWVFAVSGLSALAIALITVSWQSWRAANRNPVESLRYE